jgi:hypothetical protein
MTERRTRDPETGKPWVRRRPTHVRGSKSRALDLIRATLNDERLTDRELLSPLAKLALVTAIAKHADGAGVFQLSLETWAAEVGRGRAALAAAVRQLEDHGLIVRQPYLRPPTARAKGQGPTIFALEATLIDKASGNLDTRPSGKPDTRKASGNLDTQQGVQDPGHRNGLERKDHERNDHQTDGMEAYVNA